jgi:hypothetical protein
VIILKFLLGIFAIPFMILGALAGFATASLAAGWFFACNWLEAQGATEDVDD